MQGRGRCLAHRSSDHADDVIPVISWDYGFLSSKDDEAETEEDVSGQSPVLAARDRMSQSVFWYVVPHKGTDFDTFGALVDIIVKDLDSLGYKKACFRSDGEGSLLAVLDAIKTRWSAEVIPEVTPEGDSASNGSAECGINILKGHTRTLKYDLEAKLDLQIDDTHNLLTWLVSYAALSYNLFHVGPDGRTPRERVLGRKVGPPIARFGEAIWYRPLLSQGRPPALQERFQPGFFINYISGSNQFVVLTQEGAVRCRSVRRRPVVDQWDARLLECQASVL